MMDCTLSLFGKPLDYWKRIDNVLKNHALDTPDELAQALDPWPTKIPVYDSQNRKRLLGHISGVGRSSICSGRNIRMAATEAMTALPWEGDLNGVRLKTVEFTVDRQTLDGWVYTPVLLTSAPLADLMKVRQFSLPGESRDQAEERLFRQEYV